MTHLGTDIALAGAALFLISAVMFLAKLAMIITTWWDDAERDVAQRYARLRDEYGDMILARYEDNVSEIRDRRRMERRR